MAPKFLETRLKKEYGADSDIPYKVMNAKGFMHGNKETKKGERAEEKHEKKGRTKHGFSKEDVVVRKHIR